MRAIDGDNISYTVPTESAAMKFVVDGSYTKTINYANLATVQVTFRQVFDVAWPHQQIQLQSYRNRTEIRKYEVDNYN